MPQIEELQTSAKANAPGWSYVVDTGYDPSKVAINPTNRKRLRTAGQSESVSDLSLRQQTAVTRYLAELDKDSHREVHIAVPKPTSNKKQTTNAKRILGSGKTFQHYLEEEEARLALKGESGAAAGTAGGTTPLGAAKELQRPSKTPIARRKSALVAAAADSAEEASPAPSSSRGGKAATPKPTPPQAPPLSYPPGTILAVPPTVGISEDEIEALLAQPMLTYNAAKSAPPKMDGRRHRVFCEICGYWGRAKCMKCGARVCGIECREAHDESRCLKFYA